MKVFTLKQPSTFSFQMVNMVPFFGSVFLAGLSNYFSHQNLRFCHGKLPHHTEKTLLKTLIKCKKKKKF